MTKNVVLAITTALTFGFVACGNNEKTTNRTVVSSSDGEEQQVVLSKPAVGDSYVIDINKATHIELVWIPSGEYMMGSRLQPNEIIELYAISSVLRDGYSKSLQSELPLHKVEISKGFWMSKYEVTYEQFYAVIGEEYPFRESMSNHPARVEYEDAERFCSALTKVAKAQCRLPTEAEWEYACRAGTESLYSFGDNVEQLSDYAWYSRSSLGSGKEVGQKKPNPWGLYDMHGSIEELCLDFIDQYPYEGQSFYANSPVIDPINTTDGNGKNEHVVRGGHWNWDAVSARSAARSFGDKGGVRLVVTRD